MSGDPVSWLLIRAGWDVVASGGEHVGKVQEIAGDDSDDIFDGLSVDAHFFSDDVYVPAEQVGTIVEGQVALTLTKAEFEQLGPYVEPAAQIEVESEKAPIGTRVAQDLDNMLGAGDAPGELRAHREGWFQRLMRHLRLLGK
jgi:hypothetical protein